MLAPSLGFADHLITIPVGYKVPDGLLRIEGFADVRDHTRWFGRFDAPVNDSFDITIRGGEDGTSRYTTFDFSYNFFAPFIDFGPGISIGVQDALDRTPERNRFYTAITYRFGADTKVNPRDPGEVTVGFFAGHRPSPLLGVTIPVSSQLHLIGDYNGYIRSAGFEIRPSRELGLRLYWQETHTLATLTLQKRF
ncbi:MAG: hypothetical protein JSS72_02660 [Armatimonadetes bacterium]|nr:hypothetical protein [Armatimonadota bacterium]